MISNILVVGEELVKDQLDHVTFSRAMASLSRGLRCYVQFRHHTLWE